MSSTPPSGLVPSKGIATLFIHAVTSLGTPLEDRVLPTCPTKIGHTSSPTVNHHSPTPPLPAPLPTIHSPAQSNSKSACWPAKQPVSPPPGPPTLLPPMPASILG